MKESAKSAAPNRNHGLDLLRIIVTVMVVVIHLMTYGGLQQNTAPFTKSYAALWFFGIMADCAVNCFALISGYVSYESKFRYTNVVKLHLTVLFHGILLTLLLGCLVPGQVSGMDIIRSCFPLLSNTYWYFTLYVGVLLLSPLLNWLMRCLSQQWSAVLVIGIILLMSVLPTVTQREAYTAVTGFGRVWLTVMHAVKNFVNVNRGFSLQWLAALYFIGAYMKKYREELRCKKWATLLGYFGCVALTWVLKLVFEGWTACVQGSMADLSMLIDYCSPTVLFAAIALVLFFSALRVPRWALRGLSVFVPLSFSVYIIHDHPLVRRLLIQDSLLPVLGLSPWLQLLVVAFCAVKIWAVCSGADWIRLRIFKLLRIDRGLQALERFLTLPSEKT